MQFLIDALEEVSKDDQDYWLNSTMIDLMEENNADSNLITMLRNALGDEEDLEIIWSKS